MLTFRLLCCAIVLIVVLLWVFDRVFADMFREYEDECAMNECEDWRPLS